MQFTLSIAPKRTTIFLSCIVFVLAIAGFAVQIAKYAFHYRQEWTRLFNLDREFNYPSLYSTLTLLFCALLIGIIANFKKKEADRYAVHWKILSFIFIFLGIDEWFSIHELLIIKDLRKALHLGGIFYFIWVIPWSVFVVVTALAYLKFLLHLPLKIMYLFLAAGGIYVGGALGMEMVSGFYADLEGLNNLIYGLIASVEELMEMVGVIVFIYALLSYLRFYLKKTDLRFHLGKEIDIRLLLED